MNRILSRASLIPDDVYLTGAEGTEQRTFQLKFSLIL